MCGHRLHGVQFVLKVVGTKTLVMSLHWGAPVSFATFRYLHILVISQWNIKVDIQTGIIYKHLWYKLMLWLTLPSICNASKVCESCWGIFAIFLFMDLCRHGHLPSVHCFPNMCTEILTFVVYCDNIMNMYRTLKKNSSWNRKKTKQFHMHVHSRQGMKTLWVAEHFTTNPVILSQSKLGMKV
jgi:hypothetical protein